jgi:hypothetical protein
MLGGVAFTLYPTWRQRDYEQMFSAQPRDVRGVGCSALFGNHSLRILLEPTSPSRLFLKNTQLIHRCCNHAPWHNQQCNQE